MPKRSSRGNITKKKIRDATRNMIFSAMIERTLEHYANTQATSDPLNLQTVKSIRQLATAMPTQQIQQIQPSPEDQQNVQPTSFKTYPYRPFLKNTS